jgi:hypothetical protein
MLFIEFPLAELNVILTILESLKKEMPAHTFINSLWNQYCNRGGLSKKQLEGLYLQAKKSTLITSAQLATLEAIIKKKPNRYKSEIIKKLPEEKTDTYLEESVNKLLEKYPSHKVGLLMQSKIKHRDPISEKEKSELNRLMKILFK